MADSVFIVLGVADVGDNHQERWVAGVYTTLEKATEMATKHEGLAKEEQEKFGEWCDRRNYLPDPVRQQSIHVPVSDVIEELDKAYGPMPNYDWADAYVVEKVVIGKWRTFRETYE